MTASVCRWFHFIAEGFELRSKDPSKLRARGLAQLCCGRVPWIATNDGKTIRSWGGPGKGTVEMDGSQWIPYQAATFPTPPFPEYVSGHSTYSAAAARILELWTGSDRFGDAVTIPAGSSTIEPEVTPGHPITLRWETFTDAANEAGTSRRYGGIHFRSADLAGRLLGRVVAFEAWTKAQSYFDGSIARDTLADTRAASDMQLSR